jgi:hypothetical protein
MRGGLGAGRGVAQGDGRPRDSRMERVTTALSLIGRDQIDAAPGE